MTEYAFLEMALTESYDFETFDGFMTFCDYKTQMFEWHFVEGVAAYGGGHQFG